MKKVIQFMLSALLVISASACGSKTISSTAVNSALQTTAQADTNSVQTANEADSAQSAGMPKEIDLRDGVLNAILDKDGNLKQTNFVIDGLILIGNRHKYFGSDDTETIVNNFVKAGYKTNGLNSSFYLNEYIQFYIDTQYAGPEGDVKILGVPQKSVEELESMSSDALVSLAGERGFILDYKTPEMDNNKFVGENYVNIDYPEGKYMILFTYKGKIAYFVNITEEKEPVE